jgi:membrane protease YdiL (CAAX protease family)
LVRHILLYVVAVAVAGAVLAPWLYWLARPWGDFPFRRVFDRSVLIVALAGLWPLLRSLGIRSWAQIGWGKSPDGWRQSATGFLIGGISMTVIGAVLFLTGSRVVDWSRLPGRLPQFLVTGIVVALIEETFFRGGLQQAFRREWPPVLAVAVASVVYAALHFLKSEGFRIAPEAVTWTTGFTCLTGVFTGFIGQPDILPSFVTLLLVGWVLGWTLEWTKALYWPVGLHAGWVLGNETCRWLGVGSPVGEFWMWPVLLLPWGLLAWWIPIRPA